MGKKAQLIGRKWDVSAGHFPTDIYTSGYWIFSLMY